MPVRKTKKGVKKVNATVKKSIRQKITDFNNYLELSKVGKVNKKRLILLAVLIVVLGVSLFYSYKLLVIGWVDQTPLNRISYYRQLDAKYGKDLKEQIITEQLIDNEAKKRGVTASEDDINQEIKKLEDQNGGAANLDQLLKSRGITRSELRNQVRLYRVLVTKMFGANVTVSDDEVNKYLEANKNQIKEATDQVKAQIKEELKFQKIGEAFNSWLTQARASNRVVILS